MVGQEAHIAVKVYEIFRIKACLLLIFSRFCFFHNTKRDFPLLLAPTLRGQRTTALNHAVFSGAFTF